MSTPTDQYVNGSPDMGYGLGMAGQDQEDPAVALEAMARRIGLVTNACDGCDPTDLLIAAGLAQNGAGFTADDMAAVAKNFMGDNGQINWGGYFATRDPKGGLLGFRSIGYHQFDTRFMLLLYYQNIIALMDIGWELPEGVDLPRIEDLIDDCEEGVENAC